jgi:hypothetical protein
MHDAKSLTTALEGRWHGRYGTAPCPVCQPDRRRDQNALTLADGHSSLVLHCKRLGCSFHDVLLAAGIHDRAYCRPDSSIIAQRELECRADLAKRQEQGRALWKDAQLIGGTMAELYLRKRGITCPLPMTLRFHPNCWHHATRQRLPAMLALVEGSDSFAIHRTWLNADGTGKATVQPTKAMLGAVAGGAVRLSDGSPSLVVAEGIETALSLLCGLLSEPATILAALSTSGLRSLRLPAQPGRLTVACDGDAAGRAASIRLAERAHALGWQVTTIDPGDGTDFNDVLVNRKDAA